MILFLLAACSDGTADKPDSEATDTAQTDTETGDACTPAIWYIDADGDGAGGSETTEACEAPDGYVSAGGDCDDADPTRSPLLAEVCDPDDVDEDCSGAADDDDDGVSDAVTWYRDYDGDGYATGEGQTIVQCDEPAGFTNATGDCDDSDEAINPAATEVCDPEDVDEDCDGLVDDADDSVDPATYAELHTDGDGDGYGTEAAGAACDERDGLVFDGSDCDDADAAVNPGAVEACNDLDDDCDTLVDDADDTLDAPWYLDADGDGYGSTELDACEAPSGYVADGGDCDDADPALNPGATEVCLDLLDQDCDGQTDEYTGACEPVVDGAVADLCDPAVTPVDVALCTSGVAAILSSGSTYATLDEALTFASAGEVVTVCPGRWEESVTVSVSPLGIAGFGSGTSVLAPDGDGALTVDPSVELTMTGLTIEGGAEKRGAGMYVDDGASVCVSSSQFGLNEAERSGGAIYVAATASLVLDATTFYANAAEEGGAVVLDGGGSLLAEDSTFVLDEADYLGGAVRVDTAGTVDLDHTVFEWNTSGEGGAVGGDAVDLTIGTTSFIGNAGTTGGAVRVDDSGTLDADDVAFVDNTAQEGGAIAFAGSDLVLSSATFSANAATARGGAIMADDEYATMTATCDACTFEDNSAMDGGAVMLFQTDGGTFTFTGSSFVGNSGTDGGAIHVRKQNWDLSFDRCSFAENEASDQGGALYLDEYADSEVAFDQCDITSNVAADGGGVYIAETSAAVLISTDSDWGEDTGDNSPADVNGYSYGANASFTCTADTCE